MCGHIRRIPRADRSGYEPLREVGIALSLLREGNFYPGSVVDIVIERDSSRSLVDATWWYLLDAETGKPNYKYSTFNARHLDSRLWKHALQHHRCIVIATGFGESIGEGKAKRSYTLDSDTAFLFGGLYAPHEIQGELRYSFAVITCHPHPRLSKYHDKACPLFLPNDQDTVNAWLDPAVTDPRMFDDLLSHPKLPVDFHVQQVQSTKRLIALGEPEHLPAD